MNEIISFVMHVSLHYLIPIIIVAGILLSLLAGIVTLRFCYYFYLVHGKILWDTANDNHTEVLAVTNEYKIKPSAGILDAIAVTGIIISTAIVAALIWPVTLILLIILSPIMLYPIFFQERHKKIKFKMKLKGSNKKD